MRPLQKHIGGSVCFVISDLGEDRCAGSEWDFETAGSQKDVIDANNLNSDVRRLDIRSGNAGPDFSLAFTTRRNGFLYDLDHMTIARMPYERDSTNGSVFQVLYSRS